MSLIQTYTERTLRALCSSLIPETPDLAEQRGKQHRPGAAEIALEKNINELFNNLNEIDAGPLNRYFTGKPTLPLSSMIAVLLDLAALEYVLRRSLTGELSVHAGTGIFSWLSEPDRRAVIDFLSRDSIIIKGNELLDKYSSYGGFLKFLIRGITSVPMITYYSEWDGYEQDGGKWLPDPESFTGSVQGWEQAGFPGLKEGYPVFRGYEIEEFEENDY